MNEDRPAPFLSDWNQETEICLCQEVSWYVYAKRYKTWDISPQDLIRISDSYLISKAELIQSLRRYFHENVLYILCMLV